MAEFVERELLPKEESEKIVNTVKNNDPMKPWTLVATVCENHTELEKEETRTLVGKLTLKGILDTNADGNLKLYNPEDLENVTEN